MTKSQNKLLSNIGSHNSYETNKKSLKQIEIFAKLTKNKNKQSKQLNQVWCEIIQGSYNN